MLEFFKRKNGPPTHEDSTSPSANPSKGLINRLKDRLKRTRQVFTDGLERILLGKKEIDAEVLEALEHLLLSADVGVEATQDIIAHLSDKMSRKQLNDPAALIQTLKQDLKTILIPYQQPLIVSDQHQPYVILMVGVNGTGKTTTIGKLAKKLQEDGKTVMLAAGDTFRAAAIEQLQVWGERNNIPVIAQHTGADSASVIFDAFQAASARKFDVLIADTAGRLHTQQPLMEELSKIVRVLQKKEPSAPHEIMLILDAGIGQNALIQAKKFHEMINLNSLTITKLDGTAKGGIIFNIAKNLKLPIRFVGVGEGVDDLRPFSTEEFVEALFSTSTGESHDSV